MFKAASERYYTDIESYCYSIVEGRGFQSIQKVNGGSSCGCRCCFLEQAFSLSLSLPSFAKFSAERHKHNYRLSLSSSHSTNVAVPTEISKTNPPEKKKKEKEKTTQQCRRKSDFGVKIRKAKTKKQKSQEISLHFLPLNFLLPYIRKLLAKQHSNKQNKTNKIKWVRPGEFYRTPPPPCPLFCLAPPCPSFPLGRYLFCL